MPGSRVWNSWNVISFALAEVPLGLPITDWIAFDRETAGHAIPPGWATRTTATARAASASTMARPTIRSRGGTASGEGGPTDRRHDFRIETRIFLKIGDACSTQV